MADQFDSNTRSPHPDSEIDDPLAELARIIGYERPTVTPAAADAAESTEFDLEAELMRELDVPSAPSAGELQDIEIDEALDVMLADADFDTVPEPEPKSEPESAAAKPDPVASEDLPEGKVTDSWMSDRPEPDDGDFMMAEGRASRGLLEAIEKEQPYEQGRDRVGDETGIDDDWMMTLDADDTDPATLETKVEPAHSGAGENAEPERGTDTSGRVAEPVAEHVSEPGDADGDHVLADMVRFELPSAPQSGPAEADAPAEADDREAVSEIADQADEGGFDFEDYLSTELDVFEQEVAIGGGREEAEAPESALEADDQAEFDVETALDALNDSSLDDDVAVFDDAAEELLAAINGDSEGLVSRTGSAAQAGETGEADDGWSLDSIEEAASDELDDELGDMFVLPERVVEAGAGQPDDADELELDLEQVLADSFDRDDDNWAEPVVAAASVAAGFQSEKVEDADDWLSASPEPEQDSGRDEMSEAFLGLAPQSDDGQVESDAVPDHPEASVDPEATTVAPYQSDWLDGFETSEHVVEATGPLSDDSDYYFDAGLISDADDTVEVVADIDVPVLDHDEPQLFDPDYETEIEREFADIVERPEPLTNDGVHESIGATFAAAEGWNRSETSAHADEASDEYIALERELDGTIDEVAATPAVAEYGDDYAVAGADFADERNAGDNSRREDGSRGPVLAVAVLGLAALAGLGAFGWSMFSGDGTTADGGPRIIRADKDPVKVLPENPGGVTVPNQDKAVYDRVAGGTGSASGQPALVNSAEEPVDVVQRTLDPEILPLEGRPDASEKSEERLSADGSAPEATGNGTAAPVVSPRKVRTMIVKPDGSIVAREVAAPQAEVSENSAQTLAAAEPQTDSPASLLQNPDAAEEPTAAEPAEPAENQTAPTETAVEQGTVAPVRVVQTQPIRPVANAPVPEGRPADQPVNVIGTVTQGGRVGAAPAAQQPTEVASAPAAAAPAAAAPVANPGGYYMQIASQPTVEGAQSSWRTLSSRYSSVLGGKSVDIQRADIPGKGVFHRVRVPAGSRDEANSLCSRYKAAGGSCFVSR